MFTSILDGTSLKAKLFRGFADPSRLSIVEALTDGPLSVGEIVDATGLSQSNTSNHLSCLADCGLVVSERDGRYVHYRLTDERVGRLVGLAEELLADVAHGVYACTRYAKDEESQTAADRVDRASISEAAAS